MELSVVEIDETWLPVMFQWLTDPFTNHMAQVGDVTPEGQRQWYESLATRTDYWIRGITGDGRPVGAFGLKQIEGPDAEAFLYVGDGAVRGSGVGTWGLARLHEIAGAQGIRRIRASVRHENTPSLRLLARAGYVVAGELEDWGVLLVREG